MSRYLAVISGGGKSQLEVGLGTLKAMHRRGIQVNNIDQIDYRTCSAGAICAGFMTNGIAPDNAIQIMRNTKEEDLMSKRWFWLTRLMLHNEYIYNTEGMEKFLESYMPRQPQRNHIVSVTKLSDMTNMKLFGEYKTISASKAISGIFPHRFVDRVACIDGGYTDNVPMEPHSISKYEHIFIILYPNDPQSARHSHTFIGRMLKEFSVKMSQEVNEAERIYGDSMTYPNVTVLRPPPATTSLLSFSKGYRLVDFAFSNAIEKLKARGF